MPPLLPASGQSGDMSEVKGAAGQAPQWAPAEGLLEFTHMPGHAPGQIVLLHKPTASLLAADALTNLRSGFLHKTAPQPGFAPPGIAYPPTLRALVRPLTCASAPLEGGAACSAPPHGSRSERTVGHVVLLRASSLGSLVAQEGSRAPHACCHPTLVPRCACAAFAQHAVFKLPEE